MQCRELLSQIDLNLIRLIELNSSNAIYQIACIDLNNLASAWSDGGHEIEIAIETETATNK